MKTGKKMMMVLGVMMFSFATMAQDVIAERDSKPEKKMEQREGTNREPERKGEMHGQKPGGNHDQRPNGMHHGKPQHRGGHCENRGDHAHGRGPSQHQPNRR